MPIRMNEHIERILQTGETHTLSMAFIWGGTPQGNRYWRNVFDLGYLTNESRAALEELVGIRPSATPIKVEEPTMPAYKDRLDAEQIQMIEDLINGGDPKGLMDAFTWCFTRQGSDYWNMLYTTNSITDEARGYLREILAEAREKEAELEKAKEGEVKYKFVQLGYSGGDISIRDTDRHGTIVGEPTTRKERDRLATVYQFRVDSYWRSEYTLYGTVPIEDSSVRGVVKINEDGSEELFGELNPVQKGYGFKTLKDFYAFMLKLFSYETHVTDPYMWTSRETLEMCLRAPRRDDYDFRAAMHSTFYYRPIFDDEGVSLYMNARDFERDRRSRTTIGRFLRKVAPQFSDADIEKAVDKYNMMYRKRDFTLKRGTSASDFAHAYNGKQAEMLNPATNSARKSLSNSCMRNMHIEGHSPAEVFASGDFEILWLEDENGRIGGRVVVYLHPTKSPQAGPVYGVCEHSLNLLQAALDEMGAVGYDGADWTGARLARIPVYGGDLLMIYCDMAEEGYDDGEFIHLEHRDSNICVQVTEGYVGTHQYSFCVACDDRVDDDDVHTNEFGECFCSSCYTDRYAYCDVNHAEIDRDEAQEVYTSQSHHYYRASVERPSTITVGPNVSTAECYYTDEMWLTDDMEMDVDGNLVSPRHALTMFNIKGELYSKEQLDREGLNEDGTEIADLDEEEEKEEAA